MDLNTKSPVCLSRRKWVTGFAGSSSSRESLRSRRCGWFGVSVAQASRDLDRKWAKELAADPAQAFPGPGIMKPEQAEIERLRREVQKLKAERDILKKAAAYFPKDHT